MRRVGQVRRRDDNEGPIVYALQERGYEVTRVSGKGAPDILVRRAGRLWAMEIKNPAGRCRLTAAQTITRWPVVRTVAEALTLVNT